MKTVLKEELKKQKEAEEDSFIYYYYLSSIKELMILYREQELFEFSQKFMEILEEENIE